MMRPVCALSAPVPHFTVMPGLVPGIQVLLSRFKDVDGRDKPGHDEAIDEWKYSCA
jgi:hypothetical protein